MIYIFFALSLLHLSGQWFGNELISTVTKPFLIPSLLSYKMQSVYFLKGRISFTKPLWMTLALLFSFIGDVLLMFVNINPDFFLFGLGGFLIAHVFYILTFREILKNKGRTIWPKWWKGLFILLYLFVMLGILIPKLSGDLKAPVILYSLVISFMLLVSTGMNRVLAMKDFYMLIAGTVLFVISDSLIAVNKFYHEIPFSGFWIMLTYIAAQFLIVKSVIAEMGSRGNAAGQVAKRLP